MQPKNRMIALALPFVAVAIGTAFLKPVHADGPNEAELRERCATRVSIAFLGQSPSTALVASPSPQSSVDAMLKDSSFIERFARFVNSELNPEPGMNVAEDASYTLAKHVITNDLPWKEMFVGKFQVDIGVTSDPNGLGYFRSTAWMRRFAGNELAGYRIVAAYRILQNTTGLELMATTNVDGADLSAQGRQAQACAGCHYQNWYALDKVAKILSKRKGTGTTMTFTPPTEGAQQLLGGQMIKDDADLVNGLVGSENYRVFACRLAFKFLYGRMENVCEAGPFDKCITDFKAKGTMQAALAAIAKDGTYCQ